MAESLPVVLDTNILTRGILDPRSFSCDILQFIETGDLRMYVTHAIKSEYNVIFERESTTYGLGITNYHRNRLKGILAYAVLLTRLYPAGIKCIDPEDQKFVTAANTVSHHERQCRLLTNDHHLTDIGQSLGMLNVIILPRHSH